MDEPNADWTGVVSERLIRDAMEAGVFDNLPGRGQPLPDEILTTPVYQRIANRVLQEAKVLPEWMELEREINRERDMLAGGRARLLTAIRATRDSATRARLVERLSDTQRSRMKVVNTMVLKYDMNVPAALQKSQRAFRVTEEMKALEDEINAAIRADASANASGLNSVELRRR